MPYGSTTRRRPIPTPMGSDRAATKDLDVQLVFEPGRLIAANAGILVSRVIYVKPGEAKTFLILDAGMNDLIRPAMYDAHHDILPVSEPAPEIGTQRYDVVGPVCETANLFARVTRGISPKSRVQKNRPFRRRAQPRRSAACRFPERAL